MKNNIKKSRFWEMLKQGLKSFFTKNIAIKVLSLMFAILLWGYVLMTQNPPRVKTVTDVTVSIEGEADLTTRKLTLRGDRAALLEDVSVRVRTELTSYADISADDITASINLSRITSTGKHTVRIHAKSSSGDVVSVSPSEIEVEIDTLTTRNIPIEIHEEGELPEGYWAGDVQLDSATVLLEGPGTDSAKIVKAIGTIDLTNRTESLNQSIMLALYDKEGNVVESSILFGGMPTVVAKQEILPSKLVPIDVDGAIIGREELPENFEIASYGTSLESTLVRIVGDADVIQKIESLSLEPVDVTGCTESIQQELAINVPEGIRIIGADSVNLQVTIREKTAVLELTELPIEIVGLARKQTATLSQELANVTFSGRVSLLAGITRGDVKVYADVTGLAAGTHDVKLALQIDGEDVPSDLQYEFTTDETIQVTIE